MENVAWKPQELFRIPIQVMIGMSVQITYFIKVEITLK